MIAEPMYLVWSNKQNAWWGPGGRNFTQDVWEAQRYTLTDAEAACSIRTWEPGKVPPEVAVQAPEMWMLLDTFEEIEAAPTLTRRLVDDVTRVAMRERAAGAVSR
jgi:hypothetical protein